MEFSGTVAIVTGASTGVGLGIAKELYAQGLTVVITARERHGIEAAARGMAVAVSVEMPLMSVMEALISPVAVDCCSEAVAIART